MNSRSHQNLLSWLRYKFAFLLLLVISHTTVDSYNVITLPIYSLTPSSHTSRRLYSIHNNTIVPSELYQGLGTHYVSLYIGHPHSQRQTLIVDTGSSLTSFPCNGCQECGRNYHSDNYFDRSDSTTFQLVPCGECEIGSCVKNNTGNENIFCDIRVRYEEGSQWHAYEGRDLVSLQHDATIYTLNPDMTGLNNYFQGKFQLHFGCQYHLTGLFQTQYANGILGMEKHPSSLWSQLHRQGIITHQQFSICFSNTTSVQSLSKSAGIMTLGGSNHFSLSRFYIPLVYAQDMTAQGWFTISLKAMYWYLPNKKTMKKIPIQVEQTNKLGIILDSGTTETYLPHSLEYEFQRTFHALMGFPFRKYLTVKQAHNKSFPILLLQLSGSKIFSNDEIWYINQTDNRQYYHKGLVGSYPTNLIRQFDHLQDVLVEIPVENYYRLDITSKKHTEKYPTTLHFEGEGGLIGANVMKGYNILFDVDKQRIGFSKSSCNYVKSD